MRSVSQGLRYRLAVDHAARPVGRQWADPVSRRGPFLVATDTNERVFIHDESIGPCRTNGECQSYAPPKVTDRPSLV